MITAREYLDRYLVGQNNLKNSISFLIQELVEGRNFNFLLRGASGYGKTWLAHLIGNYLQYTTGQDYNYYLAKDDMELVFDNRLHVIDEIHEITRPEFLYPLLDRGEYSFIFCTNEYSDIKEPLANRCFDFLFEEYSVNELAQISANFFNKKKLFLSDGCYREIGLSCRYSPRNCLNLSKRLYFYFIQTQKVPDEKELGNILYSMFQISDGGMTTLDRRYLELLRNQGRASLDTLANILRVPKQTIKNDIEPFLIRKELIQITPRGRIIL